jgi:hypothetical protein
MKIGDRYEIQERDGRHGWEPVYICNWINEVKEILKILRALEEEDDE